MQVRKLFLTIHLVIGLTAALLLLVLGGSGAILVFEDPIDHTLNAKLKHVDAVGTPLTLDRLQENLEQAHPGAKLSNLTLPVPADLAIVATLRGPGKGKSTSISVNPYTAAELGAMDSANTFTNKLHQFHKNLLLGETGKLITGSGALLLTILALTGLVLWWPLKTWKLTRSTSGRRLNYDIHNVVGFYSSAFMLIFGVTGAVIHWDEDVKGWLNRLAGAPETVDVPKTSPSAPSNRPLSAVQAATIATQAVPGARITLILGLGQAAPVKVTMKFPEDGTPAGRTNLYLDSRTGAILSAQTSRTAPLGVRVAKLWNREIHTGDIYGWPTRLLVCAASLALPLLALTGPLIWWGKRRRRDRTAPASTQLTPSV